MTFDCSLSNSSYQMHGVDQRVLHRVDEAFYPYDPEWKRIGVNVSGGADSAIGSSILAELIQKHGNNTELYFLTNVRVWNNRPWAGPISVQVYEKIRSMFPDVRMQRIQNFIPPEIEEGSLMTEDDVNPKGILSEIGISGDRLCTISFNRFAVHTYKLDAVYNFITNNPDNEQFEHRSKPHDRIWDQQRLDQTSVCPQFLKGENHHLVHPWKLITKDFILGQYYRRGWEDLLNTTRSCEGDKVLFPEGPFEDFTTYQHGVSALPECHQVDEDPQRGCYWCAEREWAKKRAKDLLNEA